MQDKTLCNGTIAVVGFVSALLLACQQQPEPPAAASSAAPSAAPMSSSPPPIPPAVAAPSTPAIPALMTEHYGKTVEMKAAVIRGDLAAFKQAAQALAEHPIEGTLAADWKTHLERMRDAAVVGRDATEIQTAADALAATGRTCAGCHAQLGKPKLELGAPPAEGSGASFHMARHQWAADRMWEGLMAPSDDAWVKGCEVMADAPLHQEAMTGPKSVSARVTELAAQAHTLANRARTAPVQDRGTHYSAFLATCTACHTELGVKNF